MYLNVAIDEICISLLFTDLIDKLRYFWMNIVSEFAHGKLQLWFVWFAAICEHCTWLHNGRRKEEIWKSTVMFYLLVNFHCSYVVHCWIVMHSVNSLLFVSSYNESYIVSHIQLFKTHLQMKLVYPAVSLFLFVHLFQTSMFRCNWNSFLHANSPTSSVKGAKHVFAWFLWIYHRRR